MGSQTHHPGVVYQCYHRGGVGILPCNTLLILLSVAILALKFSSLTRSPCCSSRPFLSAFNALLFIIGIPTYQANNTKELLTFYLLQTLLVSRNREKSLSQDRKEKDSSGKGKGGARE